MLFTATTGNSEPMKPLESDNRHSGAHTTSLQRPQALRRTYKFFTATIGTPEHINLFTATTGTPEHIQLLYSDHRHSGAHTTFLQDHRHSVAHETSLQRPQTLRRSFNLFTATTGTKETIQPLYSDHRHFGAHETSLQRPQALRSP